MTDWQLMNGKESNSYTYTFENFILNSSGYVYVYTDDAGNGTCVESGTELCWDRSNQWDSTRDIAILKDVEGKEIDRCVYTKSDVQDNLVTCE